jgi:DNA-binding LacI/PurR family transcriptional regulator
MRGNARVAPEIQKAVLEQARKLGIDPSQRNKTKTLAFVLSNRSMLHAFHSRILSGAEAHCAAHGWDMVLVSYNYSPHVPWTDLRLPKVVQRQDVIRAVILAGTNSMNLIQLLGEKGIPFAVLGNNVIGEQQDLKNNDVVFADDIQGGQDVTRYLIELGHRRICFVGNTRLPWFARCFEGYRHAMEEAGLAPLESSIESEHDTESGYLGTKSILTRARTTLLEKVWDLHFDPGSNVVDVHMARLRTKLRRRHAKVDVATVRGIGYRLQSAEAATD